MRKFFVSLLTGLLVTTQVFGAVINPDSYDKLFAKMNGTTTTFVDSSTANTKTLTANGNATQLPIKFNRTAGFINAGNVDKVVVPASSDFAHGTGDYTYEIWVNFSKVTATDSWFFDRDSNNFGIRWVNNGNWYVYEAGGAVITYTSTPTVNAWTHVAVSRSSGSTRLFINGTQGGSTYSGSSSITCTNPMYVVSSTADTFQGWVKEARVSNVARYTSNFTPSTETFSSDSNTKLLMHFNSTANSPIGPAIALDGSGDYLKATSTDFDFGSGNWTVEGWYWPENDATADSFFAVDGGARYIINVYPGGSPGAGYLHVYNDAQTNHPFTVGFSYNAWHHIAVSASSSKLYVFIDGQLQNSGGTSYTGTFNTNSTAVGFGGGYASPCKGYIKEYRVSNVARYTSSFTPSQTPFEADANTKLLLHGAEANGATTFVDSETTPKTITTVGDSVIKYFEDYRSSVFKDDGATGHKPYPLGLAKIDFVAAFGEGVGYFSGANTSFVSTPDSADFYMDGDFTWETFFRIERTVAGTTLWFMGQSQSSTYAQGMFWENTAGTFDFRVLNGGSYQPVVAKTGTPLINTWYHFAATRSGSTWTIWLNGRSLGTTTDATATPNMTGNFTIGAENSVTFAYNFQGRMDNVRVANGVARYTATFNPPADYAEDNGKHRMFNVF